METVTLGMTEIDPWEHAYYLTTVLTPTITGVAADSVIAGGTGSAAGRSSRGSRRHVGRRAGGRGARPARTTRRPTRHRADRHRIGRGPLVGRRVRKIRPGYTPARRSQCGCMNTSSTHPSPGPDSQQGADHDQLAANHRCARRDHRPRRRPDGATVSDTGRCASPVRASGVNPPDRDGAKATLRRAVELGVNFIDTADSYGPDVSETLIAEALHPYPDDLVIATKGGLERTGPGRWPTNGRPEHLRAACEGSLQRLRLDQIPLYQFHRPDPTVPLEDSIGALRRAQGRGQDPSHRGVQRHRGPAAPRPADDADRVGAEPLQRRPTAARSRSSICASRSSWRSCRGRRSSISTATRSSREIADASRCDAAPGRARVAARPLTGDAADPGHRLGRAPREQHRGRTRRARSRARSPRSPNNSPRRRNAVDSSRLLRLCAGLSDLAGSCPHRSCVRKNVGAAIGIHSAAREVIPRFGKI